MNYFRQSTSATFRFGPFVSESDGYTPVTNLSISASDVRLSKDGGSFAAKSDSTSGVHDEFGYYNITMNATDTASAGPLRAAVDMAGALPVWEDFTVLPANVYDSLVAGTDTLEAVMVSATSGGTSAIFGTTIDTKTFEEILEILLAMATGKVNRTNEVFKYYKQDNTTELYTLTSTTTARTRS